MKVRTSGLVMCVALGSVACSGAENAENGGPSGGAPELSAEDRAVMARMEANTLSVIELGEARIRFVEAAPGEVVILKDFPIGSLVPSVKDENRLPLDELHRAFAPEQEVPDAVHAAMVRAEAVTSSAEVPGDAIGGAFEGTGASTAGESPEVGQTSQALEVPLALPSTITPWLWHNLYCGFSGVDRQWCADAVGQGVTAKRLSHRTAAAMCGDTGAARLRFKKSGDTLVLGDIAYGSCVTMSQYHGPHGLFGVNLERTLEVSVDWAWWTVRFSGWFADEDQFISGPY